MFVRIEDDILESAANSDRNSRAAHILMEVSIAVSRGKHYVYIPGWPAYRNRLINQLSATTLNILDGLRRQDGYILDSNISQKLIVTNNAELAVQDNDIIFSPSNNSSFEVFEETHLICENIHEKHFYDKVEAFYRRYSASAYTSNTRYNVLPRHGGGATSADVLETEKHLKNHLLVIIADSDYKYCLVNVEDGVEHKDKGTKGATAARLEKMKNEDPYPYGEIYIMEECREVENLIPKKFLKELHPNNDHKAIDFLDNHEMEYLDVKEGIRMAHLYDNKVLQYWNTHFVALGFDIQAFNEIRNQFTSKKGYLEHLKTCNDDDERRKNIIMDGWGNGILKVSLDNKGQEYDALTHGDLSEAQLKEWNAIGKILFEWGLASSPLLR